MEGSCQITYLFFDQLSSVPYREVILRISIIQNLEIEPCSFKLSSEIICGKRIFSISIFQNSETLRSGALNLIAHIIDLKCILCITLAKVDE